MPSTPAGPPEGRGPRWHWPRLDTLLARLMKAQGVLLLILFVGGVGWLASARLDAAARPFAALWGPALAAAAAGHPPAGDGSVESPQLRLSTLRPEGLLPIDFSIGPAGQAWVRFLSERGVDVREIRFSWDEGDVLAWLRVVRTDAAQTRERVGSPLAAGEEAVWIGVTPPPVWPRLAWHNVVLSAALTALMAFLSWRIARRQTRPLEKLRARLDREVRAMGGRTRRVSAARARAAAFEIVEIDLITRRLLKRLREVERERALMLGGISHDLRSPLARIRLAAELLPSGAESRSDIEAILRNVDHANRLIESFMDYVRAGALPMDENVDVAAVVREAAARGAPVGGVVEVEAGTAVLTRANALLLDRLVFNLVDNAVKHGAMPVRVRVLALPHAVRIEVIDAGPGLPAGREHLLQQAFSRGDPSRGSPGTGLGLAVARQVVTRMQGEIRFQRDERGHRVTVDLPVLPHAR